MISHVTKDQNCTWQIANKQYSRDQRLFFAFLKSEFELGQGQDFLSNACTRTYVTYSKFKIDSTPLTSKWLRNTLNIKLENIQLQ